MFLVLYSYICLKIRFAENPLVDHHSPHDHDYFGGIPHEIPMISPCLLVLPFPMAFQPEASPNPCLITSAKRFTVGPPSRAKSARERRTAKRFLQPRRLGIEKNGGSNARKASKGMLLF